MHAYFYGLQAASEKQIPIQKESVMKTSIWVIAIVTIISLVGCGGGGGGSTYLATPSGGGTARTISGVVFDVSPATAISVAGVTVKVMNTNGLTLSTATTAIDGSFTLTNVPASTDIYIKTSKVGYANFNTQVYNITADISVNLVILDTGSAKAAADAFYGSAGGTAWGDAFYTSTSWFCMDIINNSGSDIPGITVSATPSVSTIKYNNGSDVYTTTEPTVSSKNLPTVGGHVSSAGLYTFTLANTNSPAVKFPLVHGEITYTAVQTTFTITGTPANESVQIPPDVPTIGQVATRGESRYRATGLTLGSHTVTISDLTGAANLHVYGDNTYTMELDCTLRSPGALTCTVPNTTTLYFSVTSGAINRDGAWYVIIVH
jgi:hypothetical protein